jgi:hypothetical protein
MAEPTHTQEFHDWYLISNFPISNYLSRSDNFIKSENDRLERSLI